MQCQAPCIEVQYKVAKDTKYSNCDTNIPNIKNQNIMCLKVKGKDVTAKDYMRLLRVTKTILHKFQRFLLFNHR